MTREGNPYACILITTNMEEVIDFLKCIARDNATIETNN
jgi:hypothetical protein